MHLAIPTLVLEPIIHIFDQEESQPQKSDSRRNSVALAAQRSSQRQHRDRRKPYFRCSPCCRFRSETRSCSTRRKEWPVIIKVAGKNKLHAKAQNGCDVQNIRDHGLHSPRTQGANKMDTSPDKAEPARQRRIWPF